MKLAISNIAWTNEEEADVAAKLQELGVRYIEIAPTKIWSDPTKATIEQINEYIEWWKKYDIEIVAFQSMLFARPDLKMFESSELRDETRQYLADFLRLAGDMGASRLVFGSPKNRQRGGMSTEEADDIANRFFSELGDVAKQYNTMLCIEPNAPQYNCDYITTADEGARLVRTINSEGFGLPGLEAMLHGAPVASSTATCLPETHGDAAHYFNPFSVEDIAKSIDDILSDDKLRNELVKKGKKHVKTFSWQRMAEQTLAVYEKYGRKS
jgi:glycosyltransferase involved in cell wall biosynthesis